MSKKTKWLIGLGILALFIAAIVRDMYLTPEVAPQPTAQENQGKWASEEMKSQVAPDASFTTLEGKTVKLSDLKGKVVVLNFWASLCKPCITELPVFEKMMEKVGKNVVLLLVSSDTTKDAMQKFIMKYTAKGHYLFISKYTIAVWDKGMKVTQDVFHTTKYPETIIISPDGQMVKKVIGGDYPWASEENIKFLESLKSGSTE